MHRPCASGGAISPTLCWGHLQVFPTPWAQAAVRPVARWYASASTAAGGSGSARAAALFVPGGRPLVAYVSPVLHDVLLLFDYSLAAVVQTVQLPQARPACDS
jgi:hypothetical protein